MRVRKYGRWNGYSTYRSSIRYGRFQRCSAIHAKRVCEGLAIPTSKRIWRIYRWSTWVEMNKGLWRQQRRHSKTQRRRKTHRSKIVWTLLSSLSKMRHSIDIQRLDEPIHQRTVIDRYHGTKCRKDRFRSWRSKEKIYRCIEDSARLESRKK